MNELLQQTYNKLTREHPVVDTPAESETSEPEFNLDAQRALLVRMDELINKEKLYLNENVSREDIARMLNVDKFQVILTIRNFLDDSYMPVILNRYRIRHSIDVMKEQPNYTVEAIAKESGFNNVRKFYRIFKDEMGMTPTEYRELLKNDEAGSVLPPPYDLKCIVNQ